MSFPQLRDILQLQPSKQTWQQLTQLLDQWQGSDLELAIEYAAEHTKCWDPKIKHLCMEYCQEIPQWIQLVASLSCYTTKSELPNWLQHLTNLAKLDLSYCISLENVDCLQNLTNMTKLNLGGCRSLEIQPPKPFMQTREEVAEYQELLKERRTQR